MSVTRPSSRVVARRLRAEGHMTADLRDYAVEEILRDGGSIHVRAIRPDDRERLVEHFHRLSARSVHFRFMGMKRGLSAGDLDYFTRPDFVHHIALLA